MTHTMAHMSPNKVDMNAGAGIVGVAAMAALVGAAAALLLAPKSGRETRSDIKQKMHDAQERSKNKATEMKNVAVEKTDELRGKAEETAQTIADEAADARAQIDDIAAETTPRTARTRRTGTL